MRAEVSYITAPTYKLCKLLNAIVPEAISFHPKHRINNSLKLINKIKDYNCTGSVKPVSFDVKSLFNSDPILELKNQLVMNLTETIKRRNAVFDWRMFHSKLF